MIIESFNRLDSHILNYIGDRFQDLLQGEFKTEFEQMNVRKSAAYMSDTEVLFDQYFEDHHGHITGKYLRDSFVEFHQRNGSRMMAASAEWNCSDGLVKFSKFRFDIHEDEVRNVILGSLPDLELLKRLIELDVRHEIGHVIDWYRFHEGPENEWKDYLDKDVIANEEYHRLKKEKKLDDCEDVRTYLSIPMESMANRLGRVSLDEYVSVISELRKLTNRKNTIEINLLDSEEITSNKEV